MSQTTREINKITGTVISISGKLILYAIVILLLFEGVTKGYEFGHEIFYATAMETAPGREKLITISKGQTPADTAKMLGQSRLINNEFAFQMQMKFYDYEIKPGTYTLTTAMTSKEILQVLDQGPKEETAKEETSS